MADLQAVKSSSFILVSLGFCSIDHRGVQRLMRFINLNPIHCLLNENHSLWDRPFSQPRPQLVVIDTFLRWLPPDKSLTIPIHRFLQQFSAKAHLWWKSTVENRDVYAGMLAKECSRTLSAPQRRDAVSFDHAVHPTILLIEPASKLA